MLIEDFKEWMDEDMVTEREAFSEFFHEICLKDADEDLPTIVEELAWQVYQMQLCVEGIIEDNDV
jgi:hypothetical protein